MGDVGRQLATMGIHRGDRSRYQKTAARCLLRIQYRLYFLDGAATRVQPAAPFLSGEERPARIFEIQQSQSQLASGTSRDRRNGRRPAPVGYGTEGAYLRP